MSVYSIKSTGFAGAMKLHIPYDVPTPTATYSVAQDGSAQQGSNVSSGYHMGSSIAETTQFIVIGCPNYTHSGKTAAGGVFLFEKVVNSIVERQLFTSSFPEDNGHFGYSVALSDSILVVGAPHEGSGKGAVYTWWRNPNTGIWEENFKHPYDTDNSVDIPDALLETSGNFGHAVAVSNDILVVGAPEAYGSNGSSTRYGAVYVYKWHLYSRRWELKNKLQPSNTFDGGKFGFALSLDSNMGIAVGTPNETVNGVMGSGAVYVYFPSNESWAQTTRLIPNTDVENGQFGHAIDFQAGKLLIGAPGWANGGSAFYYTGYWDNFSLVSELHSSDVTITSTDNQGISVSQDTLNNILYIGNSKNESNKGCVYAWEISHGEVVPAVTHKLVSNDVNSGDEFGSAVYGNPSTLTVGSPKKGTSAGFWYTFKKS